MLDNPIFDTMKQIWINLELYFEGYEFSNILGFFKFVLNFSEFKIEFISAQVTRRNLERLIAHLIVTVDRQLKARLCGTILFIGKSF